MKRIVFLSFCMNLLVSNALGIQNTTTPQKNQSIIIDVTTVLFKENTSALIRKIGLGSVLGYAITHWKNPGDVCLDLLENMSREPEQKPSTKLTYKDRVMPRCIVEWNCGQKCNKELRKDIEAYIQKLDKANYFSSQREKDIVYRILDLVFNPQELPDLAQPIAQMVRLIKQLKHNGYKLYCLANVAQEPFDIMKKIHPELVGLFDGIVISAEVKSIKPDKKIYNHLLTQYKLDPATCIFIDNDKENISAAEKLGMTGIHYTNSKKIRSNLKQLGITSTH